MADVSLTTTACWCGAPFSMSTRLYDECRRSGHTFYCPLGHAITFSDSETDKLRRERDRLKQQVAQRDDEIRQERQRTDEQRARAVEAESATQKIKRRMVAGTCPCCHRTFVNMQRHMKTKHANVVPLEQKETA